MKLNFLIYLAGFTILVIFIVSPDTNHHVLYGEWSGNINDTEIQIAFLDNNNFKLKFVNTIALDSNSYEGIYEFENEKFPAILNLKKISGINHSLYSNLKFLSSDSIRISFFSKKLKTRLLVLNSSNSFGLKKSQKINKDFLYE